MNMERPMVMKSTMIVKDGALVAVPSHVIGQGAMIAVKVFGANSNQVKPDNNAWKGGSEQLITWKFKGAVPRKSASTLGTQIYVYVVRIYVYVGHTEPRSAWNCSEYPINGPT